MTDRPLQVLFSPRDRTRKGSTGPPARQPGAPFTLCYRSHRAPRSRAWYATTLVEGLFHLITYARLAEKTELSTLERQGRAPAPGHDRRRSKMRPDHSLRNWPFLISGRGATGGRTGAQFR
jgi:hypothetical protein